MSGEVAIYVWGWNASFHEAFDLPDNELHGRLFLVHIAECTTEKEIGGIAGRLAFVRYLLKDGELDGH